MDRFKGNETNLLLITFDQWRGDWAIPRKPIVKLPTLDRLAKVGWTAESCYTSSPQCVPARLSWITGLMPSQIGVTKNEPINLSPNAPSVIRELRDNGWETGIVGKTHWSNHEERADLKDNVFRLRSLGFNKIIEIAGPRALQRIECEITKDWRRHGFYERHIEDLKRRYKHGRSREAWEVRETILPNKLYPDIWIANRGIEMLSQMPKNKPWILWISFVGPHEPFDTPRPWKNTTRDSDLMPRIDNDGWIDRLPDDSSLKKVKMLWDRKLDRNDVANLRRDYADHLKLLDDQTGKILTSLEKRNDNHKTAVLVTADHGEMLGDHNILYKSTFLEGSVRVPFIYRPPDSDLNNYQHECKPLGLTKLLKKTLKNLQNKGKITPILKWSKKQKGAIVEFDNETMLIKNKIKIVFNKRRHPIWSTNLRNDPNEMKNLLENKEGQIKYSQEIKEIYRWADKAIAKRSGDKWLKLKVEKGELESFN